MTTAAAISPSVLSTVDALARLQVEVNAAFPERQNVTEGAVLAILSNEHVFMLGPPGTGKSAITRVIAGALQGRYFERLMTKMTTPAELFGRETLERMAAGDYNIVTTGKLPEAEFAFLDEFFKSNSMALNSLLTLSNERIFVKDDGEVVKCPLITMFGASNELFEGKELEAMFDRFLFRYDVAYLARESNLRSMLLADEPSVETRISLDALREAQAAVKNVRVTDETMDGLIDIKESLRAEGINIGDRRLKRAIKALKAAALLQGRMETTPEDLVVLVDCLWREPKDRSKIATIVGKFADPVGVQAQGILDAARETARKLETLRAKDRKAYVGEAAKANGEFVAQKAALAALAKSGAGKRATTLMADATAEIEAMHKEASRAVASNLALGVR